MELPNISELKNTLGENILQDNPQANITESERVLSLGAGAFILFSGVKNIFSHPLLALGELVVGGSLLKRGVTGYCGIKAMVDKNNAPQVPSNVF